MGSGYGAICKTCGTKFQVRSGGGFFFDLLHCDECGRSRTVRHEDMGDIHLGYVKGLPGPYAMSRSTLDTEIKQTYQGEPLDREAYRIAVEAMLDRCHCGGTVRYDAPARCPGCRSTANDWERDPAAPSMHYD